MLDVQTETDSHKGALFPRVHVSETRVPGPRAPPRNKMALFEQFTIPHHQFVPPLIQETSYKVKSYSSSGFVKLKQVKLRQLSSKGSDVSCGKAKCEASMSYVAEICSDNKIAKSEAPFYSDEKDCSTVPSKYANELPLNLDTKNLWNCITAEPANGGHCSTDIRTEYSMAENRLINSSIDRMANLPYKYTGIEACDADKLHVLIGAVAENYSNTSAGVVSPGNCITTTELLVDSAASNGRFGGISQTGETNKAKTFLPVQTVVEESNHECSGANDTNSVVLQMVCSDRSSVVAGGVGQQGHDVNSQFLARILPQHVIGVIGQRKFWEARTTMLQQQKTLSMQVFELHRLIEVQRLIAAMPCLSLEGKSNVKDSTQPKLAKVSNKLVTKESLNKGGKHRSKQSILRGPKKLTKLPCGASNTTVNDTCSNPPLQALPLKPVSLNHTWGFIPTQFIKNQWLKVGSHNYGFGRVPVAFQPPILGHWHNGHQVLQSGSYVFTDRSRPHSFLPKNTPGYYVSPLASQKPVEGSLIYQLDCDPGAQASKIIPMPNATTSVLRKPSTLNTASSAHHNKTISNSQQEACTIDRQQASDCNKCTFQSTKFTGDVYVLDKTKPLTLASPCELQSERSGLGFQTFQNMVSTRGNESGTKGEVATSKVIRAVPHPASAAVQAVTNILKSIQQSQSSEGMVHGLTKAFG